MSAMSASGKWFTVTGIWGEGGREGGAVDTGASYVSLNDQFGNLPSFLKARKPWKDFEEERTVVRFGL